MDPAGGFTQEVGERFIVFWGDREWVGVDGMGLLDSTE
jgi:hypothetical protein